MDGQAHERGEGGCLTVRPWYEGVDADTGNIKLQPDVNPGEVLDDYAKIKIAEAAARGNYLLIDTNMRMTQEVGGLLDIQDVTGRPFAGMVKVDDPTGISILDGYMGLENGQELWERGVPLTACLLRRAAMGYVPEQV